jgi:hypothetical protein
MNRRGHPSSFAVLASLVVLNVGCTVAAEEKIVRDFFRSSRLRDSSALSTFALTFFDPKNDGQVQSFKLISVSEERRAQLPLRDYSKAVEDAKAAEDAFTKEKRVYQKENLKAIERVLQAERLQQPIGRQDRAVQTAWRKWRDDTAAHAKSIADARRKFQSVRALAELSLSKPSGPTPDVSKMEGELVEKDVTVQADVRGPDGQTSSKTLVVTLSHAVMHEGGAEPVKGRWIVKSVRPANGKPTT